MNAASPPVRRLLRSSHLLGGLLVTAVLALAGCKRAASDPVAPGSTGATDASAGVDPSTGLPAGSTEMVVWISHMDELFAATTEVSRRWSPDGPVDPAAMIEAALLGVGFSPGLWNHVDPSRTHMLFVSEAPAAPGQEGPVSIAGLLEVKDPARLAEGLGARPIGPGAWQIGDDADALTLRAAGTRLEVANSTAAIERVRVLAGETATDHALRLRITNAWATMEPRPGQTEASLAFMRSMKSLDVEVDVRPGEDLVATTRGDASIRALETVELGAIRTAPTAVEERLPADAMLVATMSLNDRRASFGPAFDKMVEGASPAVPASVRASLVALYEAIGSDVAFSIHSGRGPHFNVVMIADVRDVAAVRGHLAAVASATADNDPAAKHRTARIAGQPAEQLVWSLSPERQKRLGGLQSGGKLEVFSTAHDGIVVLAFGPEARDLAGQAISSRRKPTRAPVREGLAQLRATMGGCQLCIVVDPVPALATKLRIDADTGEHGDRAKEVAKTSKAISTIGSLGVISLGFAADDEGFGFTSVVPKTLLYAAEADARKIVGGLSLALGRGAPTTDANAVSGADLPKIGVPECDEYVRLYAKCIDEKLPEEVRETSRKALRTSIDAWHKAAETEAGREGLAAACRTARDAVSESCGYSRE
jgi:hypothetical protein